MVLAVQKLPLFNLFLDFAVIMALAGAERIFELMDEEYEEDEGYVTLVNAKYKGETHLLLENGKP